MFDAGAVKGRAILDDSQWVKGSKNVQNSTGKMVTSMFTAQAAFAAVQKVIQTTIQTIQKSVTAFANQEKVESQLNAVLKSTKNAAGLTAAEIKKMAAEFQKTTTFGDEAVLSAQNLLLTFTKIGKDVFPDATETVLNMSVAFGQDLKSSAVQLGKALGDPIRGITALQRVGLVFTEQQKETVKQLVSTGKTMEAQKLILKELETQVGGSARALRETFGGALEGLKNLQDDVLEDFGRLIAISGTEYVNAMISATEGVHNFLSSEDVINKVIKVSKVLSNEFLNLVRIIQKDLISIWDDLNGSFNQLFGDTDLGLVIVQKLVGIMSNLGEKISLVTSVINFYIEAYTNLFSVVGNAINVVKEFIGVIDQIKTIKFDQILNLIKPITDIYKEVILNTFNFIKDIGTTISGFFGTIVKKAVTFISNIAQPVIKFLSPVINIIQDIVNVVQGLAGKLKDLLGDVNFEGFNKSVENLNKSTVKLGKDTVSSLSDVISNASKVYDPFDTATKENTKKITDQWNNMNKNIEDRYKDTSNNLITTTNETTNGIKTALMSQEEVYDKLNKMVDDFSNSTKEKNKELAKKIVEGFTFILSKASEIFNSIFGLITNSMQNELTALKEKNAAEIEELEEQKEKKLEQIDEEGENKLEILEAQREAGIISEEEFQEREKLLEEDTANRKAELDKKLSEQILATKKKQIDKENAMEKKIFEAEKANQIACHGEDVNIKMFDGSIKNITQIKINDSIIGNDGKERKVLELYTGINKMYQIKYDNGYSWTATENHILCLSNGKDFIEMSVKNYLNSSIQKEYFLYKIDNNIITIIKNFKVEYIGKKRFYGFNIDGNNLYQLEDGTITHNTIWISAALGIVAAWAQSIAQLGPIAGAIFAGILTAAILGVAIAQTVVISQQQYIPKKAKGGKASGLTEINEGGRGEIVNLPDNSLVIPNDISNQIAENVGANNGNMINVSFKGAVISDALSLKKVTDYVMQRLNLEMRRS